jgi:protein SCO1/2
MRVGIDAVRTALLRTCLASGALLLAGGVALAAATDGFQAFTTETARRVAVRGQPADLPAVALENQSGARFTLADLRGKWLLVDFIYTRCPTFCTVLGGDFAQLERQLAGPIAQGRVQLLSISFDPTQDPPAELAAYLRRFRGQDMVGWQAARPLTADGLQALTAAFGVTIIEDRLGGYTHNAAIHLVDPEGRLVDIFDLGDLDQLRGAIERKLGR